MRRKTAAKKTALQNAAQKVIREGCTTASTTTFFFTNDKQIESIDDAAILTTIQSKYPYIAFDIAEADVKKQIIQLVNDRMFIQTLFERFDMTIYDLFTLFSKYFGGLFKGSFLKKIKIELKNNNYNVALKNG